MVASSFWLISCDYFLYESSQPPYYETYTVTGTSYERGFQHGEHFASKIRSMYTRLLSTSIFPYLNRERADVASVMLRYQDEEIYGDGKFSYQMMLESGWDLLEYIPDEYIEEMQGIADGANLPFEQILVMNTFFDTLMGFRSITFFIKLQQSPSLLSVEVVGTDSDGCDNDGDGEIDETHEGLMDPYEPHSFAAMVEIPTDAVFRFVIDDDRPGVDAESVRVQYGETVYTTDDSNIEVVPYARDGKTVMATFTPPGDMEPGTAISLMLQATDLQKFVRTPPHHPRSMRDERLTFTTAGYGKMPWQVPNQGVDDGRSQPPALGFAVRGSATKNDEMILAHNFAMLDSDIAHKHPVLIMHVPDNGRAFVAAGYPGIVWGFSGMNEDGLSYLYNSSDTLSNSFTASFNEGLIFGRLKPAGVPIGIMGREMLRTSENVEDAVDYLSDKMPTFGWNFLLADAQGQFSVVETEGNITDKPEGGVFAYGADPNDPANLDQYGQMLASVGPDDLFTTSHFQKNLDEIGYSVINFTIQSQRYWSSFYLRSVRAFWNLADALDENYGDIDAERAKQLLALRFLEDQRDGMFSVVMEPDSLRVHVAAGRVPCTTAGFKEFNFGEELAEIRKGTKP
ncbi:MAG: carcinine hydrolase/isopenicillin-N N-acyltransferase family protein [Candidatus Lernaella stagnicola]|nr:carcinine hydrolase/isopenicillin-N N-acyltransferase family protein [Candidatus Lernaella stagnicola]